METLKKLLCAGALFLGLTGWGQGCPVPDIPQNGDLVDPNTTISWTPVEGVPSYLIQLGTFENGDDILPLTSQGQSTTYRPPQGLPENATIYVELWVFNLLTNLPSECIKYSFQTSSFTSPPGCTELVRPLDGQENVPVQTKIRWEHSPNADEYVVTLRNSANEVLIEDIIEVDFTASPSLDPTNYIPEGLPPEEEIIVQITPRNSLGEAAGCEPFSFQTAPVATLPGCTSISFPTNGQFEIPLSPTISWDSIPGADGYYVSLADSPLDNFPIDNLILDRVPYEQTSLSLSEIRPLNPNSTYFLRVIPYNEAGEAQDCEAITFYTIIGCGPYLDEEFNLIDNSPPLNFPETVGICTGSSPTPLTATDPADGYIWYKIENENREIEVGNGPEFTPPGSGEYRLEIYNEITDPSGVIVKCASSQVFTVTQSEPAIIEGTRVELGAGTISIEVEVSGIGDYEFALSPDGPYQDSNRFSGLPIDTYRVYVRDRGGCGITEALVESDLTVEGFPKFFTPNGDGINDFWQFILPPSGINPIREVFIFDRYGTLLAQIGPGSPGWDGTYNGKAMPASDYWFRAVNTSNEVFQGHFSLKR